MVGHVSDATFVGRQHYQDLTSPLGERLGICRFLSNVHMDSSNYNRSHSYCIIVLTIVVATLTLKFVNLCHTHPMIKILVSYESS